MSKESDAELKKLLSEAESAINSYAKLIKRSLAKMPTAEKLYLASIVALRERIRQKLAE